MSKKDKVISVRFTLKDYINILQECENNDCSITDVIMNGVRAKEELTELESDYKLLSKTYEERADLIADQNKRAIDELKLRLQASESNIKKSNKSESVMTDKVKNLHKDLDDLKQFTANLSKSNDKKIAELSNRLVNANNHLAEFKKFNEGLVVSNYTNKERKMPDEY